MSETSKFQSISNAVTTLGLIAGVVLSVLQFTDAQKKEAESRKFEATKPFIELRQKLYLEALNNAAILASKDLHTEDEVIAARKRFAELYWGELSLVEERDIEQKMMAIAEAENIQDSLTKTQTTTYELAHSMRESLIRSWKVDTSRTGKTNP